MLDRAPDGPLRGVPVVIKDEWPLPWRAETLRRCGGARRQSVPGESGPYRALRDAGAVIAGVANMHELGSGSTGNISVYGPAHNPWDLERCPGGSSSGPAASVAGGLVAGAVGADGLGLDSLPGRLLRAHRAQADLRPLGDGGPPHRRTPMTIVSGSALPRRRRLPAARLGPVRRGASRQRAEWTADRRDPGPVLDRQCPRGPRGLRRGARVTAGGGGRRGARRRDPGPGADPPRRGAGRALGGGRSPDTAERSTALPRGAQRDQPRRAEVAGSASGHPHRAGLSRACPGAAHPGGALRAHRRARLAHGPGGGAAARRSDDRAALRPVLGRRRQCPARRDRQPDRRPGSQRAGRPRRRHAGRAAAARPPGAPTRCCSTPPRRSSGPPSGNSWSCARKRSLSTL